MTATGPFTGKLDTGRALAALAFAPSKPHGEKTGISMVTLTDVTAGPHTLDFDDTKTLFAGLAVSGAGREGELTDLLRRAG